MKKGLLILLTAVISALNTFPQKNISTADPEYNAMDRENIRFDDYQILLVNHRGFVGPRQYSITQFTSVSFLPIQAELYNFKPNWPSVMVTRDESWQANLHPHSGTFHKEYEANRHKHFRVKI